MVTWSCDDCGVQWVGSAGDHRCVELGWARSVRAAHERWRIEYNRRRYGLLGPASGAHMVDLTTIR